MHGMRERCVLSWLGVALLSQDAPGKVCDVAIKRSRRQNVTRVEALRRSRLYQECVETYTRAPNSSKREQMP